MDQDTRAADSNPQDATTAALPAAQDHSWGVTGANWFLIAIAAALRDNWLMHGTLESFLGNVTAVLIMAAIPTCIVYLAVRDKKSFRWRRALTISAWCVLAVMFYPVFKEAMASAG